MKVLGSLIFLLSAGTAFGDACDQISEKACSSTSPAVFKDPTGSVTTIDTNSEIGKLIHQSSIEIDRSAAKMTDIALRDPNSASALREWVGTACSKPSAASCRNEVQQRVKYLLMNDLYDQTPFDGKPIPSTYTPSLIGLYGSTVSQLTSNPEYQKEKSALLKTMIQGYAPAGRFEKLAGTTFPQVQDGFQEALDNIHVDSATRKYIQSQLSNVVMSKENCNDNPSLNDVLSMGMELRNNTSIVVCPGYLRDNSSQFKNMFVLGHEMSHSFDASVLESDKKPENKPVHATYNKILGCLSKKFKTGKDPGLQEQLKTEVWADFWGTEVLASWMKSEAGKLSTEEASQGLANVLRGYCSNTAYAQHPPTKKRYELILSHPDIRSKLKCKPLKAEAYCGHGVANGGASETTAPQSHDM